jgi:hypothetical protein
LRFERRFTNQALIRRHMTREEVALALTQYALTNVQIMQNEYFFYMGKWQDYLDQLADAHTAALNKVQTRFKKIRQEQEEARRNVMMALSVIGIVGTAWLGAMVEHVWYPKMFGKVEYVDKIEQDIFNRNIWTFGTKVEFSEVVAKTVGDTIHETTGGPLDWVLEKLLPESTAQMDNHALEANIRAAKFESFKTTVDTALRNQSSGIIAQLSHLLKAISKHPDFGMAVIQTVESKMRNARLSAADLKNQGRILLDDYFDALRHKLADKWFYYGNMPNTARLPLFAFNVELQAWAFWILSQKWELKMSVSANAATDTVGPYVYSYSNGEFEMDEITRALEELAEEEIVEIERDGIMNGADEFAAAVKLEQATTFGNTPVSAGVEGNLKQLNKDKEQIFAWAKGVPGQVEHPALDYFPRTLGSISTLDGVFPSVQ